MKVFNLPDLGEGLPDAEVREWYVKEGDEITSDQPLVAMETAKALVDVPAPFSGKIEKLFGQPGDTIDTGNPLVGFVGTAAATSTTTATNDTAAPATTTLAPTATNTAGIKATPAVRALARQLGVDLSTVTASGERISAADVKQAAGGAAPSAPSTAIPDGMEKLSAAKRAMVLSMTKSHQSVVPVTLMDDADLHAWDDQQNVTIRIIRALIGACQAEPMLNASFDDQHLAFKFNDAINIGLAVDTPHGLYVPVMKDSHQHSDVELRQQINQFKQQAQSKSIAREDLHGATIMLSNFGALAGRYASPIVVPPMVAIIGVGKMRDAVVAVDGQPAIHRILPLSITVDHRAVTGGEAARFLHAMMLELSKRTLA